MKKRILSMFLALTILVSIGNIPVLAQGSTTTDEIQSISNLGVDSPADTAALTQDTPLPVVEAAAPAPTALQANAASDVKNYTMNFNSFPPPNLDWIGGKDVTKENASGDGWEWYAVETGAYKAKTLVLKGLNFTTSASLGISLPYKSTIVLQDGTVNNITLDTSRTKEGTGIKAESLTVTGGGTLNIDWINNPINTGYTTGFSFRSIFTDGYLNIDNGIINVIGTSCVNAIVYGNGTGSVVNKDATSVRSAIYASSFTMTGGALTLTQNTSTNAQTRSGAARTYYAESQQNSAGIYADNAIDLQGGTVNITANITNNAYRSVGRAQIYPSNHYGMYCKNDDITVGKDGACNITIKANNDANNAGNDSWQNALIAAYYYGLYAKSGSIANHGDTTILLTIANNPRYVYSSGWSTLSQINYNATGMMANSEDIQINSGDVNITVNHIRNSNSQNISPLYYNGVLNFSNYGIKLAKGKLSITGGNTQISAQNPIELSTVADSSAVKNANVTLSVIGEEKGTLLNKALLFDEDFSYHWKTDAASTEHKDSQDIPYQWKAADQFLELFAYTPLPAPDISFSFVGTDANKLMDADSTMEYSLDGGKTYRECSENMDLTDVYGQITAENGIRVRLKKTETVSASLAKKISVTQPDAPKDLSVSNAPDITGTGSIGGVTSAMEYRKVGETEYTPCQTDTLTELYIGEYQIRFKAGALSLPSADTSVTVKGLVPVPSAGAKIYTGTTLKSDLTNTEVYTVTKNRGGIDCADYEVCITLNDSDLHRWENSESPDKTLSFTIEKAKALVPSVLNIRYDTESLEVSPNTQYKTADGSWTNCTETMSLSSLGWDGTERTLLFRTAEDKNHYISDEVPVVLPARPDAPTAEDFIVTKTTGTAENGELKAVEAASYEYRINESQEWTDWSGSTLTGIPGDTEYTIRLRSGDSNFHSDTIKLNIQYGPKTDVSSQITFPDAQEIYNGTAQGYEGASTTDPSGGIWTYTYSDQSGKALSTAGKPKNAGTYLVTAHYESDRAIGTKAAQFTILPKELTAVVTCTGKVYDGSRDAIVTIDLDSTVPGDSLTASYTSALYHSSDAETGKTVTVEGIALSGEDAANYQLINVTATCTADIAKAVLSGGTVQPGSGKDYDGLSEFSHLPITYQGSVAGEVVTGRISGTVPESHAGSYNRFTVTAQVIDAAHAQNYSLPALTDLTGTIAIQKIIPRMSITAPVSQTGGQDIKVTVTIENPEVTSGFPSAHEISLSLSQKAVLKTDLRAVEGMPGQYMAEYTLPAYDAQTPENNKVVVMAGLPNDTANYLASANAATREIEISKRYSNKVYYTITAEAGVGGSISPTGSVAVRAGSNATFTITPDSGYIISDVTVDGNSVGSVDSYSFQTVSQGHTITASFQANPQGGSSLPFHDVDVDHWSYQNVVYVLEQGLMNGTDHTMFSPDLCASRGMIVTMLYRLETQPQVSGTYEFSDVHPQSYYADAVTWAVDTGIASGYNNDVFGPNDVITREQLAVLLFRYAKQQGYAGSISGDTSFHSYSDVETISDYAADAMPWACDTGLLVGDNQTLMPKAGATRAQVAAIFNRFCEYVMKVV